MNKTADKEATVFDAIEGLRTDYLRELTGLSKILIALSTGALGFLLTPFGVDRTAAHRPRYSALSNAKIERLGLAPMPPLETAVRSYFAVRARLMAENR